PLGPEPQAQALPERLEPQARARARLEPVQALVPGLVPVPALVPVLRPRVVRLEVPPLCART
ncbi:MAG: hypothetical protein WBE08_11885, partial [Methyloceanibacter sp.]